MSEIGLVEDVLREVFKHYKYFELCRFAACIMQNIIVNNQI